MDKNTTCMKKGWDAVTNSMYVENDLAEEVGKTHPVWIVGV